MSPSDRTGTLVSEALREYAEDAGLTVTTDGDTCLLGEGAVVDSLGLVIVVTSFEAKVNDSFDSEIVLANEKAMSMRSSPFRSTKVLADYALELLKEAGKI